MHEFWCGYVKPKHGQKANLCYMDTNSFIVYVETVYIYKDTAKDVETRFDTSNYELDRPSSKGTNEKTIGFMKDELDGKITTKFFGLRAKTQTYSIDDNDEDKKASGTKKCVIKRKLKLGNHRNCLEATKLENKINHLEKNKINIDSLKEDSRIHKKQ